MHKFTRITVEVPEQAGQEIIDKIFDEVANIVYESQPEERDWDVFVYAVGGCVYEED